MKNKILFLVLALSISSCFRESGESFSPSALSPKEVVASANILLPDSFSLPVPVPVVGSEVKKALPPDVFPTNINIKGGIKPRIVTAGNPKKLVPGKNGLKLRESKIAVQRFVEAGVPEIIRAKDPYSPGNNPFSFSFYTRLQGAQHDDISCIDQDHKGNIWIGTYGGGVIRFDGLNFTHYTEAEGLSQNYILSLLPDSKGNIWFGTRADGAMMFDGSYFHYLAVAEGLVDNRIENIFEDSQGNIWFGTYGGVSRYDGSEIISFTPDHGLAGSIIYSISEDQNGNMWFGSRGEGISMFDGEAFYNYTENEGLAHNYIVASIIDKDQNIWFCTDGGGVCRFDGKYFYHYTTDQGLSDNHTNAILEDIDGNIWVGTRSHGLEKLHGDKVTSFTEEHGLINLFVTSLLQDRNGNIWFGTYGGGLSSYKGNLFRHFSERQGLSDGFVRSIAQDRHGNLWFGTNRAGVFKYDGKSFYNYNTDHGLTHNRVGSIVEDKNGNMWFATTGRGVSRFDGHTFTNYTTDHGLSDDFILSMIQDSDGNLWFVNRNTGVTKFDGRYFTHYTQREGISDNNARCIIQDSNGNIWIGTRAGGLTKIEGDRIIHFKEDGGLSFNNILDIKESSDGIIWIATNGRGVTKFDGENYTHFSERDGLESNFVYSILEDSNGNMWFGTRMGLSRLLDRSITNPEESTDPDNFVYSDNPGLQFRNYTEGDGFLGIGSNSRAIFEDKDGMIWIGANDLLTELNPYGIVPDTIAPDIQVTGVGLFNEKLNWAGIINYPDTVLVLQNGLVVDKLRFSDVTPWYGLPENLSLPFDKNYITFNFTGITSNFSGKVQYTYWLEGLEPTWGPLSSRPDVSYANLVPGNYSFRVRAVNSEGFWSDEFVFSFQIRPPWKRTWMAYALFGLILLTIFFILFMIRKQIVDEREEKREKQLLLEQEVAIARRSAEFKQNFLANMSHEIRTPLTGILGMASMLSKMDLGDIAKDYINALTESGETLRETINMILDISKIEAGKLEIKESTFSIKDICEQSVKLFETICSSDVQLKINVDESIPEYIVSDRQRVNQIVKNFLSNAVKFTCEGSITIRAARVSAFNEISVDKSFLLKMEVCDTGIGIDKEKQERLFTPFYQTGDTSERTVEGTGLGLAICKELASMLGGEVGVESEPGKGSCFWFTFLAKTGNPDPALTKTDIEPARVKKQSLNILLVEDKVVTQKVVSLILNAMGNTVTIAENGKEALEIYAPNTFDLILMDIQMPVIDGVTATKKLREQYNILPPIVGLSANAFEGDREKYMSLGLDEYITKPVKEADFKKIITRFGLTD